MAKKSTFGKDFKAFISRGNVVDMAVGVIVGGAFGKIVSSLVSDIVMPLIGLLLGRVNFAELKLVLASEVVDGETVVTSSLNYGQFILYIIDFLIIALCVFTAVRLLSKFRKKKEEAPAAPAPEPAPTKEELLLAEIRDLMKEKK